MVNVVGWGKTQPTYYFLIGGGNTHNTFTKYSIGNGLLFGGKNGFIIEILTKLDPAM